jgi:hypothetical protein
MAGYSETPLPQKLGIKPGLTVVTINTPKNYRRLLGTIPEGATFSDRLKPDSSFVHVFIEERRELERRLPVLREKIADAGTVWVSWPKRSAGVPTDVTEDVVRAVALPLGFVDVKVCAIDETWSGLKCCISRPSLPFCSSTGSSHDSGTKTGHFFTEMNLFHYCNVGRARRA